jgi:uncharacterized protein YuzE
MDPLLSTIQRCNLQIKLDDTTEGYGNCFPNAIVQQYRRPEIRTWLQNNKPQAIVNHHTTLRKKFTNFALKSRHPTILNFKLDYDQILEQENRKSWTEFWNEMAQEDIWVDYLFVQVCAWYMELDMLILTTSSTLTDPFIFISGNFHNLPAPLSGPPLLLGNYTNVHYQSLLPINSNRKKIKNPENKTLFEFNNNGKVISFKITEENGILCHHCKKECKNIIKHLQNRAECRGPEFLEKHNLRNKRYIDKKGRSQEGTES